MKKLVWKELREMRLVPIAVALLAVVGFLAYEAVMAWMARHNMGGGSWRLDDCGAFLTFGVALSGILAGSAAIAPETGSGTLAFLTSLPIGRPRLWAAKVGAGAITMAVSAATVTVAFIIMASCLFPGEHVAKGVSTIDGAVALTLLTAYCYCMALLVSTLVDRTVTAVVVAVIASVVAAMGLFLFVNLFDKNDLMACVTDLVLHNSSSNSLGIGFIVYIFVVAGLLSTSFTAFCRGDSLRTRRRLTIAAVTLSAWMSVGGLSFAAYGRHCQEQIDLLDAIQMREQAQRLYEEETHPFLIAPVFAPAVRGQDWFVTIQNAWIGGSCHADIDVSAGDLDTPGAIPVRAVSSSPEIKTMVGHPGHFAREYYRGGPGVKVFAPSTYLRSSPEIVSGQTVATVRIIYTPMGIESGETETVHLYDRRGRHVAVIYIIVANKLARYAATNSTQERRQ